MSANENGKRLAAAHLVFNVVTGAIAIAFIYQLVAAVNGISSAVGIADDDYTLKLAVFHSVFNLLGIVVMLPLLKLLVSWLQKLIPETVPEVDQPKYLNPSSAAFPGTALEAVRLETQRIYEAAVRIIVDALGLKASDVSSDAALQDMVEAQTKIHHFDIDAMYDRYIKGIYSAVVAFISETEFSRREEQTAGLQWLREACAQLVEAVKDTDQLQGNLIEFIGSENDKIRAVYNRLRVQVATTIRELERIRSSSEGVIDVLALDAVKLQLDEEHTRINEELVELVAGRAITPTMGSSLVNDSRFAHDIAANLIRAAQTLFVSGERDQAGAAHEVVLDRGELERLGAQAEVAARSAGSDLEKTG